MQFINKKWQIGQGNIWSTHNPVTGARSWEGRASSINDVERAVLTARAAFYEWSVLPLDARINFLQQFADLIANHQTDLAECIAEETGKPLWEAKTEVVAMINKVPISIEAYHQRTGHIEKFLPGGVSITKHKPLGVMAVLGPFNFPGHLPNGHIIPALLAGNTVVFKPSELTPKTAILTTEIWEKVGLPAGVFSLILGDGEIGKILTSHPDVNGILFTGSFLTGKKLHEQLAGKPEKLLALEMGGNNPLIVWQVSDVEAAAYTIIQSAFISAGQRCTCARRLIISNGDEGEKILIALKNWIKKIKIGYWREQPEPFMGPVISEVAAKYLLNMQQKLIEYGGNVLMMMEHLKPDTGLLSPGLIDVSSVKIHEDIEIFGPLLQVFRVNTFDEAIATANNTRYGLVAGLLSDSMDLYRIFYNIIHAGVVSWNRATTGASSAAPFGGIGWSGNFRPGGYYTADYCAYPVASSETTSLSMPTTLTPGLL